jgi:serine/threonine protein kinase
MATPTGAAIRSKEWEGRTISGQFPLRQWLGSSDHSSVFVTERAGERAAIKFIHADSDAETERQLASWRGAARLSHPNLIRIFECGRAQLDGRGYAYVVMEWADEDLSQILPQRPLTPAEISQLLPPLLGALSYLHNKGFLHGRIKPSNVLATGDQLKLSMDQIVPLSAADVGKMRRDVYDAPETAAGILTPAGDLWSVGVTLYTALTQNLPEERLKDDPAHLASIPEPFRGIVRSCLQLDPKRRTSIADILTRLDPEAAQVERMPDGEKEGWRGNRIVATLLILVTAVVIAFIVFLSSRTSHSLKPAQNSVEQRSASASPASEPAVVSSAPNSVARHDSQGSVLHQALPEVSQSARNTIRGRIRIVARVEVDAGGKVTHARLTTFGPSQYFARLTLQAAERWQFSAPVVNSLPVASVWSITFRISRKQTQAMAERLRR